MIRFLLFYLLSVLCVFSAYSQTVISGYIQDADSGERLIAANILHAQSSRVAVSNEYGFFSLHVDEFPVTLYSTYVGYQSVTLELEQAMDSLIILQLSPSVELETVTVVASETERPHEQVQMSQIKLPIKQVKNVPTLFGEPDVLKAIQLLPGVQSGTEGTTGIYVRGGASDQNLILLDGVPVYNASHVLGVFSVFNGDAMKSVTLTKGGFPAKYGGRLSSVIDIRMKDGNNQKFHGEGAVGLLTSRLTLEGPLGTDKLSFLVSGRRTYIDLIANPIIKSNTADDEKIDPSLYFYDLNAKLSYTPNKTHRFYLSAYSGADVFKFKFEDRFDRFEAGTDWGNLISALRWNWLIKDNLFLNTTATYSKYKIDILAASEVIDADPPEKFSALYNSGIEDIGLKWDFDYYPAAGHNVKFGLQGTHHTYSPGAIQIEDFLSEEGRDTTIGSRELTSAEFAAYIQDEIQLGDVNINVGLHASSFHGLGSDNYNYYSLQPRLGIKYAINTTQSLKASFSSMRQYINLLTSETLSFPTDLWVPSTEILKPQDSWQAALGYSRRVGAGLDLSLEGYYKKMSNVVAYKSGTSFLTGVGNQWENTVTQGDGTAYGLEFLLEKKKGNLTGWIGYTLAWNNRSFDDLNNGNEFPFRYDRRHDFSIVASYQLGPKVLFNANWVYATGNAISLPERESTGDFFGRTRFISESVNRNAYRMSNYHRGDFSIEFIKKKRTWQRSWVIGAYNIYANANPFFVRTANRQVRNPDTGQNEFEQYYEEITVLPMLPYVSYKFKF